MKFVRGGGLAPRLAKPIAERHDSQAAARLAGPAAAPMRLVGSHAPKPGEDGCAPHLVGLAVERRMQEQSPSAMCGSEAERDDAFRS